LTRRDLNNGSRRVRNSSLNHSEQRSWLGLAHLECACVTNSLSELLRAIVTARGEAVRVVNSLSPRPRFVVVCGDLADARPEREPAKQAAQLRDVQAALARVAPEVALVCVCGNHDVGDRPTRATLAAWRARFGDDFFEAILISSDGMACQGRSSSELSVTAICGGDFFEIR
jgi:predicted MPP superfamily phosphohydrolase